MRFIGLIRFVAVTEQRSCVSAYRTGAFTHTFYRLKYITGDHEPRTLIEVERDLTHVWV